MDVPGERVGGAKPLPQHATEVEYETNSEPGMGEPKPLKGGLRQDERLGVLECNDVRGPREPIEESHFAEEVAGFEHPNALRPVIGRHAYLEQAARDDEEASVDFAFMDGELALRVQPRLCVLEDHGEIGLVQVGEKSAMGPLAAGLRHSARGTAPAIITF